MPSLNMDEMSEFVVACVDMLGRTGAREFQIRFDEEQEPVVWVAVVGHSVVTPSSIKKRVWNAGAGMTPDDAAFNLVETVLDGGLCTHCGGVVGVERDWDSTPEIVRFPDGRMSCWTCYDPELKKFRRGCENA